jgi:hypothetical protein
MVAVGSRAMKEDMNYLAAFLKLGFSVIWCK